MKKLILTALIGATGLVCGSAFSQEAAPIVVEFQGPGGHSSSNYGRTSGLHAAARSVIELQKMSLPAGSYTVSELRGGNSVNSIASDGSYVVKLNARTGITQSDFLAKVTAAAKAGTDAENAFRNVKPGDLTAGAPADVRYSVKPQ
ncbi:MAG: hypothetical protein JWP79_2127 [Polaromonas sp.]|jgi:hypothetical protein|nr:hypothetical protein [Polaromonas sp.]MDB5940373.1 hypothetical protein [Polaromonas sp.]